MARKSLLAFLGITALGTATTIFSLGRLEHDKNCISKLIEQREMVNYEAPSKVETIGDEIKEIERAISQCEIYENLNIGLFYAGLIAGVSGGAGMIYSLSGHYVHKPRITID